MSRKRLQEKKIDKILKMHQNGMHYTDIARKEKVSIATVYNYIRKVPQKTKELKQKQTSNTGYNTNNFTTDYEQTSIINIKKNQRENKKINLGALYLVILNNVKKSGFETVSEYLENRAQKKGMSKGEYIMLIKERKGCKTKKELLDKIARELNYDSSEACLEEIRNYMGFKSKKEYADLVFQEEGHGSVMEYAEEIVDTVLFKDGKFLEEKLKKREFAGVEEYLKYLSEKTEYDLENLLGQAKV